MKRIIFISMVIVTIFLSACSNQTITKNTCGIEQCHGTDLTCGTKAVNMCTEEYKVGDFCRDYFSCKKVGNDCVAQKHEFFDRCVACANGCNLIADPEEAFRCEANCRDSVTDAMMEKDILSRQ